MQVGFDVIFFNEDLKKKISQTVLCLSLSDLVKK